MISLFSFLKDFWCTFILNLNYENPEQRIFELSSLKIYNNAGIILVNIDATLLRLSLYQIDMMAVKEKKMWKMKIL